jgi:acyl-CoA synthetase (AMP-forming)/AMP-acid ligase II
LSSADWLGKRAEHHPDRIAVIDAANGRRHTYQGFDNRANQIAHFCERWVGLQPGDCVGLLSTPSDDVLQIVVAAGKLGLTALLLDPVAATDELIVAVNEHSPRTVFYGLAQAGLVQEIWFEVDSVEHFIPLRGAVDTANFEDIVAHYPPLPPSVSLEGDSPWVCFANEKPTWSHGELLAEDATVMGEPRTITAPLYRPAGLVTAVQALKSGQCVTIAEDSITVIESPTDMRPTEEAGFPSQRNVPQGRSWLPHEFL